VDCTVTIKSVEPADGSQNVSVESLVTVTFDVPLPSGGAATLAVDGVSGTTEVAADSWSMSFTPDVPFDYETSYTVDAEVCVDSGSSTFTTSSAPLDASDLEGKSYSVLWEDINFSQPNNLDALLAIADVEIDSMLVQIRDVDLTNNTLGAVATTGYDDPYLGTYFSCDAVVDAGEADFSLNPLFSIGPTQLVVPSDFMDVILENFELYGAFSADGEELTDVYIFADIDSRPLGLGCSLVAALAGGSCVACPDGELECIRAAATAATAERSTVDLIGGCP
jgi:hypothetical protein